MELTLGMSLYECNVTKNAKADFIVVFIFPPKKINISFFTNQEHLLIIERDSVHTEKINKYREY